MKTNSFENIPCARDVARQIARGDVFFADCFVIERDSDLGYLMPDEHPNYIASPAAVKDSDTIVDEMYTSDIQYAAVFFRGTKVGDIPGRFSDAALTARWFNDTDKLIALVAEFRNE